MYDVVCVGSGLIGGAASSAFRISRILAKKPKGLSSLRHWVLCHFSSKVFFQEIFFEIFLEFFFLKFLSKLYVKILVLLIDAAHRPYFKPKETKDLRQIAVNTLSRNLLDDIGAWENIESRAWPVHRMRIGESMGVGGIEAKGDIFKSFRAIVDFRL